VIHFLGTKLLLFKNSGSKQFYGNNYDLLFHFPEQNKIRQNNKFSSLKIYEI